MCVRWLFLQVAHLPQSKPGVWYPPFGGCFYKSNRLLLLGLLCLSLLGTQLFLRLLLPVSNLLFGSLFLDACEI